MKVYVVWASNGLIYGDYEVTMLGIFKSEANAKRWLLNNGWRYGVGYDMSDERFERWIKKDDWYDLYRSACIVEEPLR